METGMLMFIIFPVIAVEHQRIAQNNSKKGECPMVVDGLTARGFRRTRDATSPP